MLTIVSVASPSYFPYLRALVLTAKSYVPSARMLVELVNGNPRDAEAFRKNHPNITVLESRAKDERVFCSNRKCFAMKEARNRGKGPLIWIDADSLIMKPFDGLEAFFEKDLVVRQKKTLYHMRGHEIREVYSGVFIIGDTPNGNRVLDDYIGLSKSNLYFGSDQDNLAVLFHRYR